MKVLLICHTALLASTLWLVMRTKTKEEESTAGAMFISGLVFWSFTLIALIAVS